eukprot:734297-Pleurochrysis_carterae.AAC.17
MDYILIANSLQTTEDNNVNLLRHPLRGLPFRALVLANSQLRASFKQSPICKCCSSIATAATSLGDIILVQDTCKVSLASGAVP